MEWLSKMNEAINYIEANINEKIDYAKAANIACCSLSRFQNMFLFVIGITPSEYVRRRRMALAANELINDNTKIIDLSFKYGYEFPAAFTRSFKAFHGLSPSAARKFSKYIDYSQISFQLRIMGGFSMNSNSEIKGWFLAGMTPQKYQMYLDEKVFYTGTKSACIKSIDDEYKNGDFATIMQTFQAKNFLGKRVQFSGFVKSHEVNDWCGLWLRIDDNKTGTMLKFDNMESRSIKGTTEWNNYSCVLDVPDNATDINIGMLICGKGQVWLDNTDFHEVDYNTPTTDVNYINDFPDNPINLSFE